MDLTGAVSPVKDPRPSGTGAGISNLTVSGGLLYFTADDGTNGNELWVSDGTALGTALYFAGDDGATGTELWSVEV